MLPELPADAKGGGNIGLRDNNYRNCSGPLMARGFRPGTPQFTEAIGNTGKVILALSILAHDPKPT
jgi:hypothetical protein